MAMLNNQIVSHIRIYKCHRKNECHSHRVLKKPNWIQIYLGKKPGKVEDTIFATLFL